MCYCDSGKLPIIAIGGKVSKEKTLFSARIVCALDLFQLFLASA